MALTRKMLKAMGIEEEKIEQIIEAHTETVDALKNERDELREKAEQLPDVQKQLDKLKAEAEKGNADSYKVKYEALKEDFDKYKGEVTAKETKSAKENALREALKKKGVLEKCIPNIIAVTNLDEIELDDKGAVTADTEKGLGEKWSGFIPTQSDVAAKPETPPTNTNGGKAAFDAMPLSERMKFANEHPAEAAEYMANK